MCEQLGVQQRENERLTRLTAGAVSPDEVASIRRELEVAKLARNEALATIKIADDELNNYKSKFCDLEANVASKGREIVRQGDLLKKQEATVQQLSQAKVDAALLAKQWEKRYDDLLAAANLPLADVQHEDPEARLRQVANVAERMRVALGKAVGTLW